MNLVQLAFPALISATSATLEAGDSAIPLDLHLSRRDRVYPDLTSREDNEVTLHVLRDTCSWGRQTAESLL